MTDFAARRVMMVDTQVRPSDVTKFPIIAAMLAVPREAFVPAHLRDAAYVGNDVDLGAGRVVLDARVLAKLLDSLDISPSEMVLDIGCGLGYSSAVISRLADAVVAVETGPMASNAQARLLAEAVDNVAVIEGPLTAGCAKHGPYDVALIQGGVEVVPPEILAQVKDGGRIAAVFMDGPLGIAKIGYKSGQTVNWRFAFNASLPVLPGFEAAREFLL
ncbi:MAG: protein-L-isoaspartate O-methyltransferase [Cypionkella sp.]|nr:protein-L-isoaspartate O-methyltransferase [Cypionkella sp.]